MAQAARLVEIRVTVATNMLVTLLAARENWPMPDSQHMTDQEPVGPQPPRYLRFARALLLGAGLAAAPVVLSQCGGDTKPGLDAAVFDAGPTDGATAVDGPLPPPDLPKVG